MSFFYILEVALNLFVLLYSISFMWIGLNPSNHP